MEKKCSHNGKKGYWNTSPDFLCFKCGEEVSPEEYKRSKMIRFDPILIDFSHSTYKAMKEEQAKAQLFALIAIVGFTAFLVFLLTGILN
jgi:hypothetical protein